MDTNKLFATVGAFLIASGGVAAIRAYADASASALMHSPGAEAETIQTLPTITVRPTRAEIDAARRGISHADAPQANIEVSGGGMALDMPYYSFGVQARHASKG